MRSRASKRWPLVGEIHAEHRLDVAHRLVAADGVEQALPLAGGDRRDHHPSSVLRREVTAERPVEVVADRRPFGAVHDRLPDVPEVPDRRVADVGECEGDVLTLAGVAPPPRRGEDPGGRRETGDHVPSREHVVHRRVPPRRAGDHREPDRAVHRVVERGGAVAMPGDLHHHHVAPPGGEGVVGQLAARRQVGQEAAAALAGPCDQLGDQLPALRCAEVDGE